MISHHTFETLARLLKEEGAWLFWVVSALLWSQGSCTHEAGNSHESAWCTHVWPDLFGFLDTVRLSSKNRLNALYAQFRTPLYPQLWLIECNGWVMSPVQCFRKFTIGSILYLIAYQCSVEFPNWKAWETLSGWAPLGTSSSWPPCWRARQNQQSLRSLPPKKSGDIRRFPWESLSHLSRCPPLTLQEPRLPTGHPRWSSCGPKRAPMAISADGAAASSAMAGGRSDRAAWAGAEGNLGSQLAWENMGKMVEKLGNNTHRKTLGKLWKT